jgi:hypothetical protein
VSDDFVGAFSADPGTVGGARWSEPRLDAARGYIEFSGRFAGCSFDQGLYRFHDSESGPRSATLLREAFPSFNGRACPFAFDWLGRQFALDADRRHDGEPLVLLFEPGTGEALELPLSFGAFHAQLDELRESALAASFFADWSSANASSLPLQPTACVGYDVPLYLGGADTVANLTVVDFDVYWSLAAQLLAATRDQPPGTPINDVSIEP